MLDLLKDDTQVYKQFVENESFKRFVTRHGVRADLWQRAHDRESVVDADSSLERLLGLLEGHSSSLRELLLALADFIAATDAFTKMKKLRADMDEKRPLKQKAAGTDHRILGGFLTSHDHKSGAVVEILHLGCSVPKP